MPKIYEMPWRNKFLTADATTLDEMIAGLERAVATLRAMRDDGVALDAQCMSDDYAWMWTTRARVAKKYGMTPREEEP